MMRLYILHTYIIIVIPSSLLMQPLPSSFVAHLAASGILKWPLYVPDFLVSWPLLPSFYESLAGSNSFYLLVFSSLFCQFVFSFLMPAYSSAPPYYLSYRPPTLQCVMVSNLSHFKSHCHHQSDPASVWPYSSSSDGEVKRAPPWFSLFCSKRFCCLDWIKGAVGLARWGSCPSRLKWGW